MEIKFITDVQINCLEDLSKIKHLVEEGVMKINKTKLAKRLGVDRRTVGKYLEGYEKPKNKSKVFKCDKYEKIIRELLSDEFQEFYYISFLYRYLKENFGLKECESTFLYYIDKHTEFRNYFKNGGKITNANSPTLMFETPLGHQAQIDWKESMAIFTKEGEELVINIFCFILSNSRYRLYFLTLEKTRLILFDLLVKCFETVEGIPKDILCDNMSTIMDEARTEYSSGKINKEAEEFSKQFGFNFKPCIVGSPETKAKIESPMKILDELRCYSGKLSLEELQAKLVDINNRENSKFHNSYKKVPLLVLQKEKGYLLPLPREEIRSQYKIKTTSTVVSSRALVRIKNHDYFVPPEYYGKKVEYQIVSDTIYIYFNTRLIRTHKISDKQINYFLDDYKGIVKLYEMFDKDDEIAEFAKKNLKEIDQSYGLSNNIQQD